MKDTKSGKLAGRQPLANKRINLSRQAREQLLLEISSEILHAKLSKGDALKKLRLQLFSASQADYATMIGIGRKALSEIENDKGNYTEAFLQKVFAPVGLVVTVIPKNLEILREILKTR